MTENGTTNLPAQIANAISSVAQGMVPGMIKSLDRLVGAAIDVPVAKLEQKKAKINAQTESYKLVEASIAQAAVTYAGGDREIVQRAMNVLVRKEYRKQFNREAVAKAMVEEVLALGSNAGNNDAAIETAPPDDDWLNMFERYVEDASSERLQGLWGRVLAGEIRQPGRFSTRTLRFLSEFSQADALTFEHFAMQAFGDGAPKSLVVPPDRKDVTDLVYLEANGLIQGISGVGLHGTYSLNEHGLVALHEGDLRIVFKGEPNSQVVRDIIALTPLGQELLSLVRSRNPREAAKNVAMAFRGPDIHDSYLLVREKVGGTFTIAEAFWKKDDETSTINSSPIE